jgi:uncharacterized membrane protein
LFKLNMSEKEAGFEEISYTLGLMSIISAILSINFGFIFGISGLILSRRKDTPLSKKARKLSIIGIIVSIVMLILVIVLSIFYQNNLSQLGGLSIPAQ